MITGAHGVKGEIRVTPYGGLEEARWGTVYVNGRPMKVKRSRANKGHLILEIEGLSDRDSAEGLAGTEVFVPREDLAPLSDDEFYYSELVGLDVVTDDGRALGLVEEIIPTGSNDVLQVAGPLGEVLIPVIDGVVLSVDTEKNLITVHLLEGLLPGEKGA